MTVETDCMVPQTGVGWEIWIAFGATFSLGAIILKIPTLNWRRVQTDCIYYAGERLVLGPSAGNLNKCENRP